MLTKHTQPDYSVDWVKNIRKDPAVASHMPPGSHSLVHLHHRDGLITLAGIPTGWPPMALPHLLVCHQHRDGLTALAGVIGLVQRILQDENMIRLEFR